MSSYVGLTPVSSNIFGLSPRNAMFLAAAVTTGATLLSGGGLAVAIVYTSTAMSGVGLAFDIRERKTKQWNDYVQATFKNALLLTAVYGGLSCGAGYVASKFCKERVFTAGCIMSSSSTFVLGALGIGSAAILMKTYFWGVKK